MKNDIAGHPVFYVATNGNDAWSGRWAAPTVDGHDGPFASLGRARQAIREIKHGRTLGVTVAPMSEQPRPPAPLTVMIRGGVYYLNETFVLSEDDSGSLNAPVTWTAYPGEQPVFSGGRIISNWRPYHGHIFQADFPGTPEIGWRCRQLFLNGRRLPRARHPKMDPTDPLHSGWAHMEGPAEHGSRTAFRYAPDALHYHWRKPTMGEVTYFFYLEWGTVTTAIRSIDTASRVIRLVNEGYQFECPWYIEDYYSIGWQTFRSGNRFCVENMLENLDQPGEWCYDSDLRRFYYWPSDGAAPPEAAIVVPVLDRLWDLDGASWVNLRGLTFTHTTDGDDLHPLEVDGCGAMRYHGLRYAGEALRLKNASHCRVEECLFDAVGGNGVYLYGGCARNTIRANDIRGFGASGVALAGSEMKHPRFNDVADNYIHHGGLFNKYAAGVFLGLSDGNVVRHNRIEYLPHHGVNLADNPDGRNIVEFNEIRYVCRECHDNGAINAWMERAPLDGQRCGHVIRYNLIADCYCEERQDGQIRKHWTFGVYLDNFASNCLVYGNIIIRAPWAGVFVHAGRNNVIDNNIFIDCGSNLRLQIGITTWAYWRWKGLAVLPSGNHFTRNICYQTQADPWVGVFSFDGPVVQRAPMIAHCDDNVYCYFPSAGLPGQIDSLKVKNDQVHYFAEHISYLQAAHDSSAMEPNQGIRTLEDWRRLGFDGNSVAADPLFIDPDHGDYRLRPDSPALALGFVPIDFSRIGLRRRNVAPLPLEPEVFASSGEVEAAVKPCDRFSDEQQSMAGDVAQQGRS